VVKNNIIIISVKFLRAKARATVTALARHSHRNSVGLSVCPSVTQVDQSKTVQARITKFSHTITTSASDQLFSPISIDDYERL